MKKEFLALLLGAIMMISVFGTASVAAQSSAHSAVPDIDKQVSFSGSYTGNEVMRTADSVAVTRTQGTDSGPAKLNTLTFKSDGKTITGKGSGTGQGQFFGSQQGPYSADITWTLQCTLIGKSVHGTYSADVTINGAVTHVEGPLQGTFDGSTMNVHWSSHVMQKDDGSIIIDHFNGFIEFVLET